MTAPLIALLSALTEGIGPLAFAVFLRIGAAMALMPGFGEAAVPIRVRLGLTLAFSLAVLPIVAAGHATTFRFHPVLFLSEPVIGLAFGAFLRLGVIILQVAGAVAGQSTSLSQVFAGAASPDPLPAFGNLLLIAGLALAMTAGLHVKVVLYLAASYDMMPMGQFPSASDLATWGAAAIARAFATGVTLAAPFIIVAVIYNVALGAVNKAMPQLMVAFVGAPAITFGGLLLLVAVSPFLLQLWLDTLDAMLAGPVTWAG